MFASQTRRQRCSYVRRSWYVLKSWVQHPRQVATVCPSSSFLTEHVADRPCIHEARRILELGPGAGGTTRALLEHMRPNARLLAIEKTDSFAPALNALRDRRLSVAIADARELLAIARTRQLAPADVVVSGIPFSHLNATVAEQITRATYDVLRPGGVLVAYQLKPDIARFAQPLFGEPKTEAAPLNLPPLRIFVWTKR